MSDPTAAPSQTVQVPTVAESVLQGFEAMAKQSADLLAKALGIWTAARAAISTVASGVAVQATMKTVQKAAAKYLPTQLTPAVLADMVVRNILPDPNGQKLKSLLGNIDGHGVWEEAALSGVDKERMNALILDSGESYGILDALRMYNRGTLMPGLVPNPNYPDPPYLYEASGNLAAQYGITKAELETVVHYSRVRDEFVPDLLKLARNTLSPADAVALAVKQVVSTDVARTLFEAAGGVGEQFDALVAAAGDSAGVEKSVELAAHGVISREDLHKILGLSRLNPRFYYLAMPPAGQPLYDAPLNRHWLPPYEIREAAITGLVSLDQAYQWLLEMGYPAEQAKAFSVGIASGMATTVKVETESMVLTEYAAHMLSEAEATKALEQVGYHSTAIPYLLKYAQAKEIIAARNAAITRIRQGFLLGLLNSDQATSELSKIGTPQPAINVLVEDWTAEKSVPHTQLTTAQIGKLLETSVITTAEAEALWKMRGYTTTDISLLLHLYPAPVQATPPRFTSGNRATVVVGQPADVTISASGSPEPTIIFTGILPAGLVWETPAAGTARIAGAATAGTEGNHVLTLEAENGSPTPAVQTFTLTVNT